MSVSNKIYLKVLALAAAGLATLSLQAAGVELLDRETARAAVLAPVKGDGAADKAIRKFQENLKQGRNPGASAIRLGWAFVAKARVTNDPGYYKMAELCVQFATDSDQSDALLLSGHIADALHKFADAEKIARTLIGTQHARWESFALLGDALMEQGKLEEAIGAYQRMIDIRPCLQTYVRVAHVRWLKGDLEGARDLMRTAVEASTPLDPEPAAWAYTRLGSYQFQAGATQEAMWSARRATELVADYPAALFLQARLLTSENKNQEAVALLKRAVMNSPLPEYQWFLADVARSVGDEELAKSTEAIILARGKMEDPRSFALFLATRRQSSDQALKAAKQELENRRDVFSYDAVAWASFSAGKIDDAAAFSKKALLEGTQDARLAAHAAIIASAANSRDARALLKRAKTLRPLLLPSERELLDAAASNNSSAASASARSTTKTNPKTMQISLRK